MTAWEKLFGLNSPERETQTIPFSLDGIISLTTLKKCFTGASLPVLGLANKIWVHLQKGHFVK